jgi:hypothetical protein
MSRIVRAARRLGSAAVTAVQIAAMYDPDGCHCGRPIPADRTAYCSNGCCLADKDHGTDYADEEAS